MSFALERDETIDAGIRRILREQIDKADRELAERADGLHEAVHQVRKRCKKVRGVYRLVRHAIPEVYGEENARFRDLSRSLSSVRDAEAMLEAYDALFERFDDEGRERFGNIRRRLTFRRNALTEGDAELEAACVQAAGELAQGRSVLDTWSLDEAGFGAVAKGLCKTYGRARTCMAQAAEAPTDENLHQWRKRVKYHRYHLRVLCELWPAVVGAMADEADRLGSILGDDHDFAVLSALLLEEREEFEQNADLPAFLGLIEVRREELRSRAFALGRPLLALEPKRLRKQVEAWWEAMRGK